MRHQYKVKKLGRDKPARESMIISQAKTLLKTGKLTTTTARAKVTASFVDSLLSKVVTLDNTQAERYVEQKLRDKDFAGYVVGTLKPLVNQKQTGFTSSYKMDFRKGDNADMSMLVLIKQEAKSEKQKAKKTKSK